MFVLALAAYAALTVVGLHYAARTPAAPRTDARSEALDYALAHSRREQQARRDAVIVAARLPRR